MTISALGESKEKEREGKEMEGREMERGRERREGRNRWRERMGGNKGEVEEREREKE